MIVALALTLGCRTAGAGKDSTPPSITEKECRPGAQDPAADFKELLLKQGQWSKDGERWKANSAAPLMFKAVVLAQENPELLKTPGQTLEDKWSAFYESAIQFKNSEMSLPPPGTSNTCP